jgi:hypothetical protein
MRPPVRFVLALLAGLALLTWGASVIIEKTTRDWFERDLRLRAELAVSGAREMLIGNWRAGRQAELRKILIDFTHDERILSVAACNADLGHANQYARFPFRVFLPQGRHAYPSSRPARGLAGVAHGRAIAGGQRAGECHPAGRT